MVSESRLHLLCSIGTTDYADVTYRLADKVHSSRFAPVALAHLLGLRSARVSILVTSKAREKWYETVAAEFLQAGLEPEPVDMPETSTESEILEVFHRLVGAVQEDERVVLDVTYSLRHLPFVYLAALTYLTAYRKVTIQGIYYGAFELKKPTVEGIDETPVLGVTPLFRLIQWYHAVQTARESGNLQPVARTLRGDVARLFQTGQGDQALSRARDGIDKLSAALAAGLPLETGIEARRLRDALTELERASSSRQVAHLSLDVLRQWVKDWATLETAESKASLPLTEEELLRQLELGQWYADRGELRSALLMLREWLVSLFVRRRGEAARWLDLDHREAIAGHLGALGRRAHHGLATDAERKVASVWNGVADRRNQLAHAGMTRDDVRISRDEVARLVSQCRELLDNAMAQDPTQGSDLRLLVTPMGLSPGVVYSALQHLQPDRVLVITSADAKPRLLEAMERAGAAQTPVLVRELTEPFIGFAETTSLIDTELRSWLIEAGEVVVNLTGGTTVLQYAAERVADEAWALGVPVRRVAVVDRRTPKEQQEQPYLLGELVLLGGTREDQDASAG